MPARPTFTVKPAGLRLSSRVLPNGRRHSLYDLPTQSEEEPELRELIGWLRYYLDRERDAVPAWRIHASPSPLPPERLLRVGETDLSEILRVEVIHRMAALWYNIRRTNGTSIAGAIDAVAGYISRYQRAVHLFRDAPVLRFAGSRRGSHLFFFYGSATCPGITANPRKSLCGTGRWNSWLLGWVAASFIIKLAQIPWCSLLVLSRYQLLVLPIFRPH